VVEQDAQGSDPDSPVLVAEPDPVQRRHLEGVLRRAGIRTRFVSNGREALEAARRQRPRLVVLEVRLGDTSGYEVCRALREEFGHEVAIMFVSSDRTDPHDRVAGLLIGADAYLSKPLVADELLARLRALVRRPGAYEHLRAPAMRADLTDRELQVLQLLADGLDQGNIARRLVISPKTVGKHIEHILSKLPARSRAEAVAIAYRRGLHSPAA
jgi:DNA-binding NarL/FixJ family response regulator